ncbi:MAG: RsmB/NOP family class I SAM-dependent RNA methyltransferase [Caldilineales bacterium]|nr:RsmB/NOP family class I SAM-dependent RNA methyltransferase [Caldilineales bacterium]
MSVPLPPPFRARMKAWLGSEADAFLAGLDEAPRVGLRVNTLKVTVAGLRERLPWSATPVPWCAEGFVLSAEAEPPPGRHPYHAAGLYYLQDPSAMAAAVLLDPQPGEWVLDLCAAPGGKATHLAARMADQGLLVANESVPARAAALVDNLERAGATRILVTTAAATDLAARWPGSFDRVLVDAPCSGEGMFRKSPVARREWSPAVVTGCALRQRHILDAAARLVRPGGRLLYATCTFAPEENEAVVAGFLRGHPDFSLVAPPALPGFDPGRPDWIESELAAGLPLERCVRIWPHRTMGEGHFFALLQREGEPSARSYPPLPTLRELPPLLRTLWEANFAVPFPTQGWLAAGEWLHLSPIGPTFWQALHPRRIGLRVGQRRGLRFEPDHALALAALPPRPDGRLDLALDTAELRAFMQGEPFPHPGPDGWVLVCGDGFGLGWGKRVQGVVKNHLPARWRHAGTW